MAESSLCARKCVQHAAKQDEPVICGCSNAITAQGEILNLIFVLRSPHVCGGGGGEQKAAAAVSH